MNVQTTTLAGACPVSHCHMLGRILSVLTPGVLALVEAPQSPRLLTGFPLPAKELRTLPALLANLRALIAAPAAVPPLAEPVTEPEAEPALTVAPLALLSLPEAGLDALLPQAPARGSWQAFHCRFGGGDTDLVLMHLPGPAARGPAEALLRLIWPVLREDALRDLSDPKTAGAETVFPDEPAEGLPEDGALLWLIRARIDLAALVVNPQGLILRQNVAARRMMAEGRVLMRGHGGLHAASPDETRHLRTAIAGCAAAPAERGERRLFLHPAGIGAAVPVTLARYIHEGRPTSLVTLLLPEPPAPARIESIARDLGLTAAEARVAAMLQTGLPNRSAASSLGLTEQSFSTYAKRVFSKLQVSSRAEMAQMLTWQSHGGVLT